MARPALAIFTPLPPTKSGIADYVLEQLPVFEASCDVVCVIADDAPNPQGLSASTRWCRAAEFESKIAGERDWLRVYHAGNNPFHEYIYRTAETTPGVLVLHDYLQNHISREISILKGQPEGYFRRMIAELGGVGARLAQNVVDGIYTENSHFLIPVNSTLLNYSLGVIVHSWDAYGRIRNRYPNVPMLRVPHHLGPPPADFQNDSRDAARTRLKLPAGDLIFTSLGFITPPKQVHTVLRALANVRDRLPKFRYVLAGELASNFDLEPYIRKLGLRDVVTITGYNTLVGLHDHILASDVILNLRFPSAGESSGTLLRAMGMGRPTVIFDYATFADFPAEMCVKLPLDVVETTRLEEALLRLATHPEERGEIGRKAAEFVKATCKIEETVGEYVAFAAKIAADRNPNHTHRPPSTIDPAKRMPIEEAAREIDSVMKALPPEKVAVYFGDHIKRLTQSLSFVPEAGPGMSCLELGSYGTLAHPLTRRLKFDRFVGSELDATKPVGPMGEKTVPQGDMSYPMFNFNLEFDRFPFDRQEFDLVLCWEVLEHMTCDPMWMMAEINRILKMNGLLILTTPNILSARAVYNSVIGKTPYLFPHFIPGKDTNRHNLEYVPGDVRKLMHAAGLEIVTLETRNSWSEPKPFVMKFLNKHGYPAELRGDNIIVVARKVGETIERYPDAIYFNKTNDNRLVNFTTTPHRL
jgi:glycosyltransferase involved in cell wall biosynthesis/SAM-dependent methyltransferase